MPTKHRRRFHTDRIVRKRRAQLRRIGFYEHLADLPLGRWADRHPLDCGRAGCHCCHWDKLDPGRRSRDKAAWRREVAEQLPEES